MGTFDPPVGGSTGLDHESSAGIDQAAQWLATMPAGGQPRPVILALRERFGLTALEACQAIKEAGTLRRSTKSTI